MKKACFSLAVLLAFIFSSVGAQAQADMGNIANVQQLKTKWPDKEPRSSRDSLIAIYNSMVIAKNEYILSHREYSHFYSSSSTDYFVVEEYKDLASMEKASDRTTELEKKAWPDETMRNAFMDAMGAFFENWHGDGLYSTNPKLSKN